MLIHWRKEKDKALLYTLTDSLEELKVETLSDTVAEEEIRGLVNTMTHRLAEVEAETLCRTLVEAETQVLVEGRSANVHIEAKAVVHTVAYRLI